MRELILINSGILILAAVYLVTLRKGSFYQANRFSILVGLLVAIAIPMLQLGDVATGLPVIELPVFEGFSEAVAAGSSGISVMMVLFWIWIAGVAAFMVRFLVSMTRIFILKFKYRSQAAAGFRLIHVAEEVPVFSFFRWIFWNDPHLEDKEAAHILAHEQVHAKQWHSADVILMELLCAVFWFNPAVWWLANEMKAVHEFIADDAVVNEQADRLAYSRLLIGQAFGNGSIPVTSPFFNQSLLKQRVMKLNQNPSSPVKRWKYTILLPIFALFIVAAACTKEVEAKEPLPEDTVFEEVDAMPEYPGGQEAMMTYLMENLKYPETDQEAGDVPFLIKFTITSKGKVKDVESVNDVSNVFTEEGIRVVSIMPDWTPAMKDGKPVAVELKLPIKFTL